MTKVFVGLAKKFECHPKNYVKALKDFKRVIRIRMITCNSFLKIVLAAVLIN